MAKQRRNSVIVIIVAAVLLPLLLISACDFIGIGGDSTVPGAPEETKIITPANNATILVGGPVQVQSGFTEADVARVELRVKGPRDETERLLRADTPTDGWVLQQWIPDQVGAYNLRLLAFNSNNEQLNTLELQVEVIDNSLVSIEPAQAAPVAAQPSPTAQAEFQSPTATPPVSDIVADSADAVVAHPVTPEVIVAVSPTAIPRFPPPPPAPGVPHGPTQDQLPELMPPVCDAAKYIGPFIPNTSERIIITEPDDVPAKTVGGTLVHRAWRIQNIGTCTWGPGYELAFYGGRAMGSGGVAFEAFFPDEPDRRNIVINQDQLIGAEGKPNQVAVGEVLLMAPVTPGIHLSYWRMRNPHGVFFGPIIGVTLEVVRDCQFGIYGAPVINRFEILGVGNVYRPTDPVNVRAEVGEPVTLDWSIINADNYDIVVRDPVGNSANISTNNRTDRNSFIPTRLGRYTITLFADNGHCTATAVVNVDAVPPEGEQFNLIIITSGAATTASASGGSLQSSASVSFGSIKAEWEHFDPETDEFVLISELYERETTETCYDIFGYTPCFSSQSDWQLVDSIQRRVGGEGDAQGAAVVTNVERVLCNQLSDPSNPYELRYVMQAGKNGRRANPELSNVVVDARQPCNQYLPTEIQP